MVLLQDTMSKPIVNVAWILPGAAYSDALGKATGMRSQKNWFYWGWGICRGF